MRKVKGSCLALPVILRHIGCIGRFWPCFPPQPRNVLLAFLAPMHLWVFEFDVLAQGGLGAVAFATPLQEASEITDYLARSPAHPLALVVLLVMLDLDNGRGTWMLLYLA